MQIPTSTKVGRHTYRVQIKDPGRMRYGTVNYQSCTIMIKPRRAVDQAHTYWHEVTHAILYEMGRKDLALDEKFVGDFGYLLHRSIRTARFA